MIYKVKLDIFEGPLDLLLYLVKKSEVAIADIPIATIADQYLEYLELIKVLNLDVAGEFLVMAATLMAIKSKMLLPPSEEAEEEEEGVDPRAELLQRLLEYQKYKEAAYQLKTRELLEKDIFTRIQIEEYLPLEREAVIEASLFDLVDALRKVIKEKHLSEQFMEVTVEKISVKDKMVEILWKLKEAQQMTFYALFNEFSTKHEMIVAFLAILELMRLRAVRVFQLHPYGEIRIISLIKAEEINRITVG
jgi:segregation and condensation protein A